MSDERCGVCEKYAADVARIEALSASLGFVLESWQVAWLGLCETHRKLAIRRAMRADVRRT